MNPAAQPSRFATPYPLVGIVFVVVLGIGLTPDRARAEPTGTETGTGTSEAAPRWRMRSSGGTESTPSNGEPRWRMTSSSSAGGNSDSRASASADTLGASSQEDFFHRAGQALRRDQPASTVRPTHGEAEFGRLQIPAGALGDSDSVAAPVLENSRIDDSAENAEANVSPPPKPQRPRPLWQPSFVETMVSTQGRRSASNSWSYPESGTYQDPRSFNAGESLRTTSVGDPGGPGIVLSDNGPNSRTYLPEENVVYYGEEDPWFRVGQTEQARQDPWGTWYPVGSYGSYGGLSPWTRRVNSELLVGNYRRGRTIYDSHNPDGYYGYAFGVENPFGNPPPGWGPGEEGRFRLDGGFLPFTATFDPEYAHLKAGRLYLQALWLEGGALYSDFRGTREFASGAEPGWLGYNSFALRGAAQLSDSLFFVMDGELIYIHGENELGFRGLGRLGGPNALASLFYRTELGEWQLTLQNILGTGTFFDWNQIAGGEAFDQAGRYSFGFFDQGLGRDWVLYDPVVYNFASVQAVRPLAEDWRLQLDVGHWDFFYFDNANGDETHGHRDTFGATVAAVPGQIPFAPYASYQGFSIDHYDSLANRFYVGGSGALSRRLRMNARVGYFWPSGDGIFNQGIDRFLWSVGFTHDISRRTQQTLWFGQDFFERDFFDDTSISDFIRYGMRHLITDRTELLLFAQWSQDEFLSGRLSGREFDRQLYAALIQHQVSEDVFNRLGYYFQIGEDRIRGRKGERHIVFDELSLRLTERSTGFLRYQFESFDQDLQFLDEHLYVAGVRRYF